MGKGKKMGKGIKVRIRDKRKRRENYLENLPK